MQNFTQPGVLASNANLVCVTLQSGCKLCQGLCYVLILQAMRHWAFSAHAELHQAAVRHNAMRLHTLPFCQGLCYVLILQAGRHLEP